VNSQRDLKPRRTRDNVFVTKPKRGMLKDRPEVAAHSKQEARYQAILHAVHTNGSVAVEYLSEQLGVTVVTIRRDLDAMERKGLLHRTHGGAVPLQPLFYESFRRERSFMMQVERMADEKRRIGYAAAALIKPDETICVTPGTTAAAVVRALPLNYNLTVVTSTANAVMELSKRKDIKVFVTGGTLHGEWFSLVGPHAVRSLENVSIHKFFLGADGLDATAGATSFDQDEAELLRAMAAQSRTRIAVVDRTKLGAVGNWRICKTEEIGTIVTDDGADEASLEPFRTAGIEIIRA
jgi:DeoR family transcriptional regulator, aga operon transcriptional repressor